MREFSDIIQDIKEGKDQGFTDFYERTHTKGMHVAMSYLKNHADAEDVLQDAYLKVSLNIDSLKDPNNAQAWFDRIVANESLNKIRGKSHQKTVTNDAGDKEIQKIYEDSYDVLLDENGDEVELSGNVMEFNPENIMDKKHTANVVAEALHQLNPDQEFVIAASFYNGMTNAEIAEAMGCPEGTVKSRLNRGIKALQSKRDYFEKNGIRITSLGMLVAFLSWHFKSESYAYSDTIIDLLNKGAMSPEGTWIAVKEAVSNASEAVKATESVTQKVTSNAASNTTSSTTNAGMKGVNSAKSIPNNAPNNANLGSGYTAKNIAMESAKAVKKAASLNKFFVIGAAIVPIAAVGAITAYTLKNISTSFDSNVAYETAIEDKNEDFSNEELIKYSGSEYMFLPVSYSRIDGGYEVEMQVVKEMLVSADSFEGIDFSIEAYDENRAFDEWYVESDGVSYWIAAPPYSKIPKYRTVEYDFATFDDHVFSNGQRVRELEYWNEKTAYNPDTDYLLRGGGSVRFSLRYNPDNPEYYRVVNDLDKNYDQGIETGSIRLVDTIENVKIGFDLFKNEYLSDPLPSLSSELNFEQVYAYNMSISEDGTIDGISKTADKYNYIPLSETQNGMGTKLCETTTETKETNNVSFNNENLAKYSGSEYMFLPISSTKVDDGYEVELQVFKELRVPAESFESFDYSCDANNDFYFDQYHWDIEYDGLLYSIEAPPYTCIPMLRTVTIGYGPNNGTRTEYFCNIDRYRELDKWSSKTTYNPETDYLLKFVDCGPSTRFSLRYDPDNPEYYVVMNDMDSIPDNPESDERTENRSILLVDTVKNVKIKSDVFSEDYVTSPSDIIDNDPLVAFDQIYVYNMVIDENGMVDSISKTTNTYNNFTFPDEYPEFDLKYNVIGIRPLNE